MLCFVNEYDARTAITQCLFGREPQFHAAQGRSGRDGWMDTSLSGNSGINKRFMHGRKQAAEVVPPAEPTGVGWGDFYADEGKPSGVCCHRWAHLLDQEVFDFRAQGCLADSGRPQHEYKRAWFRAVNGVNEFISRPHQTRMRHGKGPKTIQVLDEVRGNGRDTVEPHQSSP